MTRFLLVLLLCLATGGSLAAQAAAPFQVQRTGSGRPMILIPGLLSSGEVWQGTVERFRGEYELHVLTLAGFAGVPPTGADPLLASVRDGVIAYIREQKLDRPVLVGHSLGAFVSFWVAAAAPELVGPVVAVDGVPFLTVLGDTTMTAERAAAQAAGLRTMFAGMSGEALAAQTRMVLARQIRDTVWQAAGTGWSRRSDPATAGRAVAEMLTTDIRPQMARVRSPILLFMAADGFTPEQRERMLARYRGQLAGAPDARVVVAENARHFVMLDDPELFHRTVAAFLRGR